MRKFPDSVWNDDKNVTQLKEWWEVTGYSTGKISEEFGKLGISVGRNAIVGKVNRMKFKQPEWKVEALKRRDKEIMATPKLKTTAVLRRRMRGDTGKQILIFGKKYNANPRQEVIMTDQQKPDGNKSVLLKDLHSGKCKAIIGYQEGMLEKAVYCGEDSVTFTNTRGKEQHSPWCPYHKSIYTTESRK